jgi:hypothetical protein
MMNLERPQPSKSCCRQKPFAFMGWRGWRAKVRDNNACVDARKRPEENGMTWEQIESSWKQLKGDVQHQAQTSMASTRVDPDVTRESVEAEIVSYKRSLHHGTAFIRRRNPAPAGQASIPARNEQAG